MLAKDFVLSKVEKLGLNMHINEVDVDAIMSDYAKKFSSESPGSVVDYGIDSLWTEIFKEKKEKSSGESIYGIEVFASGIWNGLSFEKKDLEDIASNHAALSQYLKVPLKMGHNEEQKMTDGMPALGWVSRVYTEGEKLLIDVENVPSIVAEAMRKGLYRTVSIELDKEVKHKGTVYSWVLSAVALLGADLPAVNTLKDLNHYLNKRESFSVKEKFLFTLQDKGNCMTKEELEKLTSELAAQKARLDAQEQQMKLEKETFASRKKQDEEDAKRSRIAKIKSDVHAIFEDAIASKKIVPAQRELFTKLLGLDKEEAYDGFDTATLKAFVFSAQAPSDHGSAGSAGSDDKDPDAKLFELIEDLQLKTPNVTFSKAVQIVMGRNKELAKSYVNMNNVKV